MGATKYEIYTDEAIEIAELFKAFAHPARIMAVLQILESESNMTTLKELNENIELSQSSLSRHVEKLKNLGVVSTKVEKRGSKCYQVLMINKEVLFEMKNITRKMLKLWEQEYVHTTSRTYVRPFNSDSIHQWLSKYQI